MQLFARDTRLPATADLIYLERGHADLVRADVNAGHLICPILGCQNPRFVVRGGSKRDHFAHKPGASGHAPETIEHHNAKHLFARWLRHHHPHAVIHVDDHSIDSGQRPDVLIELDTTRHVGYEIQRAPLTAKEWDARHVRYASSGVKDVWVFIGHTYAPPVGADLPSQRPMHPALAQVLAAGRPVIFFDPHTEHVALAGGFDVRQHLDAGGHYPPQPGGAVWVERWYPLSQVRAPGGVIDVPGTRDLLAGLDGRRARWRKARADERAREVEHQEALKEAERARAQARDELKARTRAWRAERVRIEARLGATLPVVVDAEPRLDECATTTWAPDQWRWAILEQFTNRSGTTLTVHDLVPVVPRGPKAGEESVFAMVVRFLDVLAEDKWVTRRGARVLIHAEPTHPPAVVRTHPLLPPAPARRRFAKLKRSYPPSPAPEPLEVVPDDLADQFVTKGVRLDHYRADITTWRPLVPAEVMRRVPERLHDATIVTWFRAVRGSTQGLVSALGLDDVDRVDMALIVGALVGAGQVRLERVGEACRFVPGPLSPYGDR